ncbi:hypothetical protein ACP70R_030498 [Stipagrostis hirtigluma subsp. patula]
MAPTTKAALSMNLVIDTGSRRVLFAEASIHVVDFLFYLLDEPGAPEVFENDTEDRRGIDNFCDSYDELEDAIDDDDDDYGPPPSPSPSRPKERYFVCSYMLGGGSCDAYVTTACGSPCPSCGWEMATEVRGTPGAGTSAGGGSGGGPTQEAAVMMCVVMDDLTVMPMAASRLAVRVLRAGAGAAVQERTVPIGNTEGLAILNAAIQSTTVLTDVFLGSNAPGDA